jgi:hypothetical protein
MTKMNQKFQNDKSLFFGLVFLPYKNIISYVHYELFSIASNNDKVSAFSDYILANFIEKDSRYPLHL